jgi:CubicO group peptidase (beta-lactamase class C family)
VAKNSAAGYVLLVARGGKLVYSASIGLRDRARQLPMTLDTRFRIASMTKPITSVAVLMLYEEGRFHLDDPVSRFLPEFANERVFTGVDAQGALITEPAKTPITIRHLLTHTSGLGYLFDPSTPLGKAYNALPITPQAAWRMPSARLRAFRSTFSRAPRGATAMRMTCWEGWSRSSRECHSSAS